MDTEPTEPTLPADEERMTARDRRAQRVKEQGRRGVPKKAGKTLALVLVAILLIAGGVWAYRQLPKPESPPGHEHSVFRMFADGEELTFDYPQFDYQYTQFTDAHMHFQGGESSNSKYVIHVEGTRRVTLDRFFESLQVDVSGDHVRLNEQIQGGREWRNNDTHSWQLWVDHCADGPDNWVKEPKLFNTKPTHYDRMVITFAPRNATAETLQSQFDQVPTEAQLDADNLGTCDNK
jgi:hypothetical protein